MFFPIRETQCLVDTGVFEVNGMLQALSLLVNTLANRAIHARHLFLPAELGRCDVMERDQYHE